MGKLGSPVKKNLHFDEGIDGFQTIDIILKHNKLKREMSLLQASAILIDTFVRYKVIEDVFQY